MKQSSSFSRDVCEHLDDQRRFTKAMIKTQYSRESSDGTSSLMEPDEDTGEKDKHAVEAVLSPDGGYAWVVLFASFFNLVLCPVPTFTYGILFSSTLMSLSISSVTVAWIFNVHSFIWNVNCLVVGPLCTEFGYRKVSIAGALLQTISIVASAFSTSTGILIISFSILSAIGGSMNMCVSLYAVGVYFDKKRGFAMGLTTMGICVSSFVGPLLVRYLQTEYGVKGTIVLTGGVLLNMCVAAMLFQPVEWHLPKARKEKIEREDIDVLQLKESVEYQQKMLSRQVSRCSIAGSFANLTPILQRLQSISSSVGKDENLDDDSLHLSLILSRFESVSTSASDKTDKTKDKEEEPERKQVADSVKRIFLSICSSLKTLRSLPVLIIAVGQSCLILGFVGFQMWIPFAVTGYGHTLQFAAWALSASAISNALGRGICVLLADRSFFNKRWMFIAALVLMSLSILGFTFSESETTLLACVIIWGFGVGAGMTLSPTVIIDIMGIDKFPGTHGVASLMSACFFLVGGTFVGYVRDVTGSYTFALRVVAGIASISFLSWFLMPLAQKHEKDKEETRKRGKE